MTFTIFLCIIYIAPLAIVGAIHWAEYIDSKRAGYQCSMKKKVMQLYIIPLCPIVNIFYAIGIFMGHFGV